ncbi:uncharacterized protein LOC128993557 isoform X2 [Macrosteles quadrilineatus]|uniref:uncharacterized protein LOC128993557 isoform X2 n=1 Tax=Macrosteles quadrilineatus TaxID=74068 RepID=UPI0023E14D3C|nr:uncharacterized protein LOC128993557 isoform X2 [Macrosteles quadrilineatus]
MSLINVTLVTSWLVLLCCLGGSPQYSYRVRPNWFPSFYPSWYPPLPYGSFGPYGGYCCFTININIPGGVVPQNNTIPGGPLALLPNGSMILPGGSIRFPNATVVLTQYAAGVVPPAGQMPSGRIIYANNTILNPGVATSFPAPGVPLISPLETTAYPPLFLPNMTLIFLNGTLITPGNRSISTIFTRGFNPNCGGLTCHFFVPTGK